MNKSHLFRAYNAARVAARRGALDKARLDRALGLAQRRDQTPRYETDLMDCNCLDAVYRGRVVGPCKHRILEMLQVRAGEETK